MAGKQRGVAIAGLVCGAIGVIVNVLFIALIVNVSNDPTVQNIFNSLTQSPSK
jgi:chromate transport protein ChrA